MGPWVVRGCDGRGGDEASSECAPVGVGANHGKGVWNVVGVFLLVVVVVVAGGWGCAWCDGGVILLVAVLREEGHCCWGTLLTFVIWNNTNVDFKGMVVYYVL